MLTSDESPPCHYTWNDGSLALLMPMRLRHVLSTNQMAPTVIFSACPRCSAILFGGTRGHAGSLGLEAKMLQLLSVFCLLAVAIASDVLELGDTDFHARMEDEDFALVKFYAPW